VTESVHGKGPHRAVDPAALARPVGYAHGVLAGPGTTLHLAGQVGWDEKGVFAKGLVAQVERALDNLCTVLAAAGGKPQHLVSMRIYVLSAAAWRGAAKEIGAVWRERIGRWYPAMSLVVVAGLYEPDALVEIEGVAVL
jgi:enamine deaminase RidA (YjgF/YER057c/UK114 family)